MRKTNPRDLWLVPWVETIYWRDNKWYRYYSGDICKYDPKSKSKQADKVRDREVEILWIACKLEKVAIRFLDTGKEGRAEISDLVVVRRKAVDFTKYRESGEYCLTDQGEKPLSVDPHWQR